MHKRKYCTNIHLNLAENNAGTRGENEAIFNFIYRVAKFGVVVCKMAAVKDNDAYFSGTLDVNVNASCKL